MRCFKAGVEGGFFFKCIKRDLEELWELLSVQRAEVSNGKKVLQFRKVERTEILFLFMYSNIFLSVYNGVKFGGQASISFDLSLLYNSLCVT